MFNASSKDDIVTFLQRQDSALLTSRTPIEAWRAYLIKNGATGGSLTELERTWLIKQGGVGSTLHDVLNTYLQSKGFATGTISDKLKNYHKGVATP